MKKILKKIKVIIFGFFYIVFWISPHRGAAQTNPCYNIVVAQDGSGNYTKVQDAFNAVPNNNATRTVIYVKNGTYQEALTLASNKINVTLVGQSQSGVTLTFHNDSQSINPATGVTFGTGGSASTYINASGFFAENITFQNSSTTAHDPALAISISGDKAVFVNCRFSGPDDTIYDDRCRQYFSNCFIEGNTDFIFGPSTAVFDGCELHTHGGTALTAASTENYVTYGYVFLNCKVTAATAGTMTDLGRPWRPYAAVAYLNCNLGSVINPAGWDDWGNTANDATARYSEYQNTSTNTVARVSWASQLTAAQAAAYTTLNILKTTYANPPATDNWNPMTVINSLNSCLSTPTATFTKSFTPTFTRTSTPTFTRTNTPVPPTATMTSTPTRTLTATPTRTFTSTFTMTSTATFTATRSLTPTATHSATTTSTFTNSYTRTGTPTFTFSNTSTAAKTNTPTFTSTFSPTVTRTFTNIWTNSPTNTMSATPTSTRTATNTATLTSTFTKSFTPSPTASSTPTSTASLTPVNTLTATNTRTLTVTMTHTPTWTNSPTLTFTKSFTATLSATPSLTPTATSSPTSTGTSSPTMTFSPTLTWTTTSTGTFTRSATPTPSYTVTNTTTFSPTVTHTPTSTSTGTSTPTLTSTATKTLTFTATTTSTSSFTATKTSAATSTSSTTFTPTSTFSMTTTSTPTNSFTATLTSTLTPTATPTATASFSSTATDSMTPTSSLTATPTASPTKTPTATPRTATTPILYPNPSYGEPIHVLPPATSGVSDVDIKIFTTAFRKIEERVFPQVPSGSPVLLDLTDQKGSPLANGIYYVAVTTSGGSSIGKLLLMH